MTRSPLVTGLVELEVLVAPDHEAPTTGAIRASVSSAVESAVLGPAGWEDASGGEDLVEQWRLEQRGAPLDRRRVRRFSMSVQADAGAGVLGEIQWAAIGAISPTARDEDRCIDAGESIVPVVDAFPWSGGAHIADEADDVDDVDDVDGPDAE